MYVGLVDGLGMTEAAAYVRDTLPHNLLNSPHYPDDMHAALHDAFRFTDGRLCEWLANNLMPQARPHCGATALVAVLQHDTLWLANTGNARALLVHRDGGARCVTEVHTPANPEERKALVQRGGRLIHLEVCRGGAGPLGAVGSGQPTRERRQITDDRVCLRRRGVPPPRPPSAPAVSTGPPAR